MKVPVWIDTHCHLDATEFAGQHIQLLQNAFDKQVKVIVIPAVSVDNFESVKNLSLLTRSQKNMPYCVYALGIHPLYIAQAQETDLIMLREALEEAVHDPYCVAVGEIGLDFFVAELNSQELRQKQEWFYQQQLIMAREFNLPVLLHIRKSQDRVLKYLRSENIKQGIAHAFNGSLQQARQFLEQGFKLGFGGAMTWNRALQIRRLAAELQNDSIVLETDSPDIPPSWLAQNEHNTPEQIPNIANELAQLRACDLLELSAQLFQNTLEALPRLKKLIASDVFESR